MQQITRQFFEGERPLFALHDVQVEEVRFYPGESPLKHCSDVIARNCDFMAKYPFWHNERVRIEACHFSLYSRAAIWYAQHVSMDGCVIEAPKMFRHVAHLDISHSRFTDAQETLWACQDVRLKDVQMQHGDYLFMNSTDIQVEDFRLQGNYVFDGARNVVIRNAVMDSKDAFWNSEDVTVFDSVLNGEYLGWHSRRLRLVGCTISGTQPLCFATGLVLENCRFAEDADLAFEHSTVQAEIRGAVSSVKNPAGGCIRADHIGQVILDGHCQNPGACAIITADRAVA